MAQGRILSPVLSGSDELAELDQIYHQSARLLDDSNRKLQAAYAQSQSRLFQRCSHAAYVGYRQRSFDKRLAQRYAQAAAKAW